MKNAIRNDTSVLLVAAAAFTGAAIPVLSEFLGPSQPPAVAAIQIGIPSEDAGPTPTAVRQAKPTRTEPRRTDAPTDPVVRPSRRGASPER
jgi:hypothetical protein